MSYTDEFRVPFDLAVVVLAQRVDADNLPGGPRVLPMPIAFDSPGADVASWISQPVRLVGAGINQRVFLARRVLGVDLDGTQFDINNAGTGPGDSGGAWTWAPTGGAPQLISVFNLNPRLGVPEVRAWLEPLVSPTAPDDAFIGNVYVGPSDVPSRDNLQQIRTMADELADPDRDGLVGDHDNCPALYNPAQADANGDGIGTACDEDEDSVLDAADNCALFNPDQRDCDGDGLGDACATDRDGDHVPDACDNCAPRTGDLVPTLVGNPLQENCNLDAELVARVQPRGDVCDDTPCGETILGNTTSDGTLPSGRPASIVRMNRVLVHGRSTRAQHARTGFRFCPCSAAAADDVLTRDVCAGDQGDDTGFCMISDNNKYHNLNEGLAGPWRQMFMSYAEDARTFQSQPRLEALIGYRRPVDGSFRPNLAAEWKQETDRLRWSTVFSESFQPEEPLPGVLWTHIPGGFDGNNFAPALERLTSHYWSGGVAASIEAPTPFPCLRYVGPFLSNTGCSFCASAFPAPFLALPGLPGLGCGAPFEPPVVTIPDLPFDLGPLLPLDPVVFERLDLKWLTPSEPLEWLPAGGTRLLALDSQLQTALRLVETGQGLGLSGDGQPPFDCTLLNTCEPVSPPQLQAVGLTTASLPTDAADPRVMVLSARRETFWTLEGVATADAADRDAEPGDALEPQRLLVTHRLSPALPNSIQPLPLGHVLAATYRAQDDALYVLDELSRGRGWRAHSQARLLRIDVSGAPSMQVLATWPWLSHNTRYALVAAPGDTLWLAASAEPGVGPAMHVVVRLEPRPAVDDDDDDDGDDDDDDDTADHAPRWRVSAWALGDGTLAQVQPRADARGLSLIVERDGQQEAVGYAQRDLWPLRGRERGERRRRRGRGRAGHHDWDARRCF